jgi:AraC-like DNA-binding protein/CRP-like cAMP-binding protein
MQHHNYQQAQPTDIDYLIHLLNTIYPLSDALRKEIASNLVSLELEKEAILIAEGDTCHYMYFIITGALMGFSTHKGKKIITYISVENEFVSSISGMHGMRPSREGIVAVEHTRLIALPNTILLGLFEKYFDFNYIFRVMVQKYYQDAQERSHIVRVGNAKERYLYFIQSAPGFIDRIPLENIASLLDMKPQTLARIRKQHAQSLKKDEETEKLCKQLEDYILQHKPYQQKDLKLSLLAQAIDITPHKLSFLLNNHYKLNFGDFINTYRINSIKEQMTLPQNLQHFTIESMAYEAGFSSRSAFYNAFKKLMGTSPVEFSRNMKK